MTRLRANKSKLPTFKKNNKKEEGQSSKQGVLIEEADCNLRNEKENEDPKGKEKDINLGSDDNPSGDKSDSSKSSDLASKFLLVKNNGSFTQLPVSLFSFSHQLNMFIMASNKRILAARLTYIVVLFHSNIPCQIFSPD